MQEKKKIPEVGGKHSLDSLLGYDIHIFYHENDTGLKTSPLTQLPKN